jgi:hypothetical protein
VPAPEFLLGGGPRESRGRWGRCAPREAITPLPGRSALGATKRAPGYRTLRPDEPPTSRAIQDIRIHRLASEPGLVARLQQASGERCRVCACGRRVRFGFLDCGSVIAADLDNLGQRIMSFAFFHRVNVR